MRRLLFFNDPATTEIYTLSLHDALPISQCPCATPSASTRGREPESPRPWALESALPDRKSTRLNSSHLVISYAVFCLKKKSLLLEQKVIHPSSSRNITQPCLRITRAQSH